MIYDFYAEGEFTLTSFEQVEPTPFEQAIVDCHIFPNDASVDLAIEQGRGDIVRLVRDSVTTLPF